MKILMLTGTDAGHTVPATQLATLLQQSGHHIHMMAGLSTFPPAFTQCGFEVEDLIGLHEQPGDDSADLGQRVNARSARLAKMAMPRTQEINPDLIIYDVMIPGGGMLGELVNIPAIELVPHPLFLPSKDLGPLGAGLPAPYTLGEKLGVKVWNALAARSIRQGQTDRAAARESIGLDGAEPAVLGRLIATLPALEMPRSDWPDNTVVCGPLLKELYDQQPQLHHINGPLVLMASSTATEGVHDFSAFVHDICAHVTTPHLEFFVNSISARAHRDRIHTGKVDQTAVLAQASVAVIGGGHGMLSKCILQGVPVVIVPGGGDQRELAARAQRLGVGVIASHTRAEAIAEAVDHVLSEPSYRKSAQRAAGSLASCVNPVDFIHDCMTRYEHENF